MDFSPTLEAMRQAAHALEGGDVRERLRAAQTARDALDASISTLLLDLDATHGHEVDGASTITTWARTQLHLDTGPAAMLIRNATTLRDLPLVAASAAAGRINAHHVRAFTFGLKHLGPDVMLELEEPLVVVAEAKEPRHLFDVLRDLKDLKHPEDLDEAHLKGMDKEDLTVTALPDGWHVTGFLNTITGAKLKKVLDSISAPRSADDDRTGSQRRVQGLDDLLSSILGHGLPTDKGVRPHMSVFVDAETVQAAADHVKRAHQNPWQTPAPMPDVTPATLAGFGNIGPHLLMHFLCISETTTYLMTQGGHGKQAQILNAGRDRYQPNLTQRRAVLARQHGTCATPGCDHTHLEIHHTIWWSRNGTTDLDLLVGLCTRCHHLLHRGGLTITGDAVTGFHFTTPDGHPIQRRRASYHRAA